MYTVLQTDRQTDVHHQCWPEHSTMMSGIHLVIRRSPPGGAARIVAAGVIFHASGEDVRVLITCVSEMSMSLPVRVACCVLAVGE
jgi:hypothetical protein